MKANLTSFLDVPSNYEILMMQGGGSGQFDATVYNIVSAWVEKQRQKIVKELGEASEDDVVKELRKRVEAELRLDYLVTGSSVSGRIHWTSSVILTEGADGRPRLARRRSACLGPNTSTLLVTPGKSTMESSARLPMNRLGTWALSLPWSTCATTKRWTVSNTPTSPRLLSQPARRRIHSWWEISLQTSSLDVSQLRYGTTVFVLASDLLLISI